MRAYRSSSARSRNSASCSTRWQQPEHRRYAVIVDEAHGSQTGESASNLKKVLAATSLEKAEAEDDTGTGDETEDEVLKAISARGRQPNLSFFAFTATPKKKTMELFGQPGPDGKPTAFHLYSMRQAIEEGFILDVLTDLHDIPNLLSVC